MTRRATPRLELAEQTFPHSLEAERSVLGAILVSNAGFHEAVRHVRAADFFRDAHRRIFAAIQGLLDRPNGVVDLVTLKDRLATHGELDECGGPAYLSSLIDGVPHSTNVGHYAAIVKEKSLLRSIITEANQLATDAYIGEDTAAALLLRADKTFVDLQHGHTLGRMQPLVQSHAGLSEDLEYRHAHRGELTGIDTGFASVNELTMGWQAGDMIVIAARPSIGKTSLVVNGCALAAARAGKRVAIFSMEMRRRQLEYRILACLSGVPLSTLLGGHTHSDQQWQALSTAMSEFPQFPIAIDDSAAQSSWTIRAECRRLKADGGLDLAIIDYIQLMSGSSTRRGATRNEEVTDISRRIKVLADELGIPIIVLSQLSRAGETRSDPRPKLSDLRESGALEQDADLVCFLHRKHHRESGVTNFIIEKQRNGPTGTVNLTIDRDTVTFTDGGTEPEPTQQELDEERKEQQRRLIAGKNRRRRYAS